MSHRELRTFMERMRSLGYPKLISMESFRTPNFPLVAEILFWLVKNYDPSMDVSEDISTEADRVNFIKSIASFMAPKAHIKLNTRRLYEADGHAIRELLKIANLLYSASTLKTNDEEEEAIGASALDISSRIGQLKTCRTLASEITEKGAVLYDLLGKEIELRGIRSNVISRPFEIKQVEEIVKESIGQIQQQITATETAMDNLGSDEANLVTKIEKRKVELERAEKRLKSLQGVRPAYMDEYEKIEAELVKHYDNYIERFRNLAYLEQQLDEYNRLEQDKFEETESSLRRMQTRLREEEQRLLRGEKEILAMGGIGAGPGAGDYQNDPLSARPRRPHGAGQRSRKSLASNESESESEDMGSEDDVGGDSGSDAFQEEMEARRRAGAQRSQPPPPGMRAANKQPAQSRRYADDNEEDIDDRRRGEMEMDEGISGEDLDEDEEEGSENEDEEDDDDDGSDGQGRDDEEDDGEGVDEDNDF